jgi:hypothetical protein
VLQANYGWNTFTRGRSAAGPNGVILSWIDGLLIEFPEVDF